MKKTNFLCKAAVFFAVMILFTVAQQARAQTTYIVDTTIDDPNLTACTTAPLDCSLRGAVNKANADNLQNNRIEFALPSDDSGCTQQGVCTITLRYGLIAIHQTLGTDSVVVSNSTGSSRLIISGNNQSPVFYTDKGGLTLVGITIANGKGLADANGFVFAGAVTNDLYGLLNLINCVVTNNTSSSIGIIASYGNGLAIYNSTIINNAGVDGGGVTNYRGSLLIQGSTISGNMATQNGGGILLSQDSFATIENSTISGNTAQRGGGIYLSRTNPSNTSPSLRLYSSTITDNNATLTSDTSNGGGIDSVYTDAAYQGQRARVFLSSTIVAGNHNGNAPDMWADMYANSSYNLIGNGMGLIDNSGQTTNQIGTPENPIDPLLGPLSDNGGPTMTHALLPGSPAIDQGKNIPFTANPTLYDQRGLTRTIDFFSIPNAAGGDGTDIGSFEEQSAPCVPVTFSPSTLPGGTQGTSYNQTVTVTGGSGAYTFSIDDGSLPPGLTMQSSGVISGTPSAAGEYNFTVIATDLNGCSSAQSYTITVAEPVIFNAPSNLQAVTVAKTFAALRWADNSNSETGFIVEMCNNKNCNSATQIGQTAANQPTFTATGLQANKHYYFRVAAVNAAGDKTAYSNTLLVRTEKF